MRIMSYRENAAELEPKAKAFGPFIECYPDNKETLIKAEDIYKVKLLDDRVQFSYGRDGLIKLKISYEEFKNVLLSALSWKP